MEASQLACTLADAGVEGVFSYAGRTARPVAQPLPTRVGGFGGIHGLVAFLNQERFTHVIDATHPFAAQMSRHAVAACAATRTPLLAFERPPWQPMAGDDWRHASDIAAAVAALPESPARIFLAIGKQHIAAFAERPQHFYLLRMIDPLDAPLPLPHAEVILARGPFTHDADLAWLRTYRITHVVAKNAGGEGGRAKLEAARTLGLPVILIARPDLHERRSAPNVAEVMHWLGHSTRRDV